MSAASPPSDPEVAAEQAALDHALSSLAAMRQRAEKLLRDLVAAGNPDLDYVAALSRRVSLLADSPRPLLFGRIDEEDGPTWRIGRRHVEDARSDPVVIDWRAPVAVPFYRASAKDALGLARRRQIMVDRGAGHRRRRRPLRRRRRRCRQHPAPGRRRPAGRARAGPHGRDARHRRHHPGRAGRDHPGPARPAPDRAGWSRHGQDGRRPAPGRLPALQPPRARAETACSSSGPSRAFLRYIAQVLPALGEEAVVQTTIGDIAPKAKVRADEPMEVRRVKGDARMGELLRRALDGRADAPREDVSLRVRFARAPWPGADQRPRRLHRRPARPRTNRGGWRCGRVWSARHAPLSARRVGSAPTRPGSRASSRRPRSSARSWTRCGPPSPPPPWSATSSRRREQLERCAPGLFSADEWQLLLRNRGTDGLDHGLERRRSGSPGRSRLPHRGSEPLVRAHRGGRGPGPDPDAVPHDRPTRALGFRHDAGGPGPGHRAVDLRDWDEIRSHLPDAAAPHHDELTLGYRAPGRVLDFASRLLPVAAPGMRAHLVHPSRAAATPPSARCPRTELASASLRGGRRPGRRPRPGRPRRAGGSRARGDPARPTRRPGRAART